MSDLSFKWFWLLEILLIDFGCKPAANELNAMVRLKSIQRFETRKVLIK